MEDYARYLSWDAAKALERLDKREPSPFDLDVELQEEIVLRNWSLAPSQLREADKQVWYPFTESGVELTGVASAQDNGKSYRKTLDELRKKNPPPSSACSTMRNAGSCCNL